MITRAKQHEYVYTALEPDPGDHGLVRCHGACMICNEEFSILRSYKECSHCGNRTVDWLSKVTGGTVLSVCEACRETRL